MKRYPSRFTQKILFLVPTKNLVEQQTKYFEEKLSKLQFSLLIFDIFLLEMLNAETFSVRCIRTTTEIEDRSEGILDDGAATIYVMVHKVALTLLRKGIFNIRKIDIIVFDE